MAVRETSLMTLPRSLIRLTRGGGVPSDIDRIPGCVALESASELNSNNAGLRCLLPFNAQGEAEAMSGQLPPRRRSKAAGSGRAPLMARLLVPSKLIATRAPHTAHVPGGWDGCPPGPGVAVPGLPFQEPLYEAPVCNGFARIYLGKSQ